MHFPKKISSKATPLVSSFALTSGFLSIGSSLWGSLITRMETIGKPMPAIDSLLAATAAQNEYTLVTRNVRDFEHTGILLLDPWVTQEE